VLTTVNPNYGPAGTAERKREPDGQFTHWVQGTTTASFGAGITVATLTINSATTATAVLNIDAAAAAGTRNVTVTTGAEVVTLNNGFTVDGGHAGADNGQSEYRQQGQQNESVSLTGQFTHWVQGNDDSELRSGKSPWRR
jgi:hypothetical protein